MPADPDWSPAVSFPPLVEPASELTIDEVRRYSRHLIIPDVGMSGQKRLKNAKAPGNGAGGVGSPALLSRAAAAGPPAPSATAAAPGRSPRAMRSARPTPTSRS